MTVVHRWETEAGEVEWLAGKDITDAAAGLPDPRPASPTMQGTWFGL